MPGERETLAEAETAWAAHLATYATLPAADTQAWEEAFRQAEWLQGRLLQASVNDACARWQAEQTRCLQQCVEGEAIIQVYRRYQRAMLGMEEVSA